MNWKDSKFKNLSKNQIETWQCVGCYNEDLSAERTQDTTHISLKYNKDAHQTPTIEKINSKLLNYNNINDINLETSITLAAEVGNSLLMENNLLK